MAEAHSAVAFSFTVSHEGIDVNLNHDALKAVWHSGLRSWKRRLGQFKNRIINGVYPASPGSFILCLAIVMGFYVLEKDASFGLIHWIETLPLIRGVYDELRLYVSLFVFTLSTWIGIILTLRYSLKLLLTYHGWMFEPHGKMSLVTRIWLFFFVIHKGCTKLLGGPKPLLNSYQASLPKLPVPALKDTTKRYLRSVKPLQSEEHYKRMEKLVKEFQEGIGPKLQRYLVLKSWWSSNYVSDWWEEYVYLRGRSPIMVNSNYYGIDAIMHHPTTLQAARAANITYALIQFRRSVVREELNPILVNKTVPLCSAQYERQFNTTRIPGVEADSLVHHDDSKHIAVYHKGRWFKVYIHSKREYMTPAQLEQMFQQILDDEESVPADGEAHLAALTAADRIPWAKARQEYFSKGVNRSSLDAIEKAAFVLVLDETEQSFDPDDYTKLDQFGRALLHGKAYDRWFDKSFTIVVSSNASVGFNAEHSWADAPIMAHLWEIMLYTENVTTGYREDGHVHGEVTITPPNPVKLQWELPQGCIDVIEASLQTATALYEDVDLHLLMHDAYGKGFMKKSKCSPDAYIQLGLQLAYYRDAGKFSLTYEASMTRLFREGRTETVRSCTIESSEFVKAMEDPSKTKDQRIALLKRAAEMHQEGYRNAMTGGGIDRHLFCLYVVSKYLGIDSPFLKEVLSQPWRLSTSQTPHQQTDLLDLGKNPEMITAGGGFGPVADDGYGVSYIIAGEGIIFYHISSKRSCRETDSVKFGQNICRALQDMKALFE